MESEQQNPTEHLAKSAQGALNTFVTIFFWLWSLVLIVVGIFFLMADIYAGIGVFGSAALINPLLVRFSMRKAIEEGRSPPSFWGFAIGAAVCLALGILMLVY